VLATRDAGGGLVVLPGAESSDLAFQDYRSDVSILRLRHDLGQSFVSALATDARSTAGGHKPRRRARLPMAPAALGGDHRQLLWSNSATPNRTDLAPEWDGRTLNDRAWLLNASHNSIHNDVFVQAKDLGPNFRADEGFVPQVGYREGYFESGYTLRAPKALFTRVRFWTIEWYDQEEPSNATLSRRISAGVGMDGKFGSFTRIELNHDDIPHRRATAVALSSRACRYRWPQASSSTLSRSTRTSGRRSTSRTRGAARGLRSSAASPCCRAHTSSSGTTPAGAG